MATQEPPRKRRALVLDGFVSEGRLGFSFVFTATLFRFLHPPSNFIAFFAETKKSRITFVTAG